MTGPLAAVLMVIFVLVLTMVGVALYIYYGRLIMQSRVAGVPVSFGRMMGMTLAGINANSVVSAYLDAHKAGLAISLDALEAIARERGNPRAEVRRRISERSSA